MNDSVEKYTAPNIYEYATSELSQDAFICWLLSWADPKAREYCKELHIAGQEFLSLILSLNKEQIPAEIKSVKIEKQYQHIDVLCIVNGAIAILIEDKVGSTEHSGQLNRYLVKLTDDKAYGHCKIIPVYVQTGDQSNYDEVSEAGYSILHRQGLLKCLESTSGKIASQRSDIFRDYSKCLRQIEDEVESYKSVQFSEWESNGRSWIGFYKNLQHVLKSEGTWDTEASWDYVPNAQGGFWGLWWHFKKDEKEKCTSYLQIEQSKLCFKISVDDANERRELRQMWCEKILEQAHALAMNIKRPARFGYGQYMTVAEFAEEFPKLMADGVLNFDKTMQVLKTAESILDKARAIPR